MQRQARLSRLWMRERRQDRRGLAVEKERVGPQVGRPGMFEHSRGKDFSGVQSEDLSLQHLERRSERNKWNKKKQAN